jgi:hypothetical protein
MKLNDPVNPYLSPPGRLPADPPEEWDEWEERIERREVTMVPGSPEEGMKEFLMSIPESDRENYDRMQDERAEGTCP